MKQISQSIQFDPELLNKYNQPLPRYTSYPPATELSPEFHTEAFRAAIAIGNHKKTPLSLYCHIPFCETPCYFCGCNTVITKHKAVAEPYLGYLSRHIRQMAQLVSRDRLVQQLHWGGGTPNYLSLDQVQFLWDELNQSFQFDPDAEISIEVNPAYLDRDYLLALRQIGFKRISFGIQDFNPQVQEAVNRVQPEAHLFNVMDWIREAGFESVNVDLIYGLPYQTLETFQETIQKTVQLNPDRIAVFNFAYVPWMKPIQKRLPVDALPDAEEKLRILQMVGDHLTHHGYVYIGMDHFAKPGDELAIAQQAGTLHRNFQGYTTKPESDLLGFGVTSISMLQDVYVQNHKLLKEFYGALDAEELPIAQGIQLTQDDQIRRTIIMELMCEFQLSMPELERKYHLGFDLDFNDYFEYELPLLDALEADGLLKRWSDGIEVTLKGRLLIRNIAAVFDKYLRQKAKVAFSRSI
ncbi:MAG: oxygen-independent coproporphyrinogen III oxidase [Oculatellaceae cyanobacterium Prado106]|nr:oxygen-independent coproporphyrinogen III oxidase [Oculatellaceae cyanobacterium Prado106]